MTREGTEKLLEPLESEYRKVRRNAWSRVGYLLDWGLVTRDDLMQPSSPWSPR